MDGIQASPIRGTGEPHEPKGFKLKSVIVGFRCQAMRRGPNAGVMGDHVAAMDALHMSTAMRQNQV
jgi:hypothetical protein